MKKLLSILLLLAIVAPSISAPFSVLAQEESSTAPATEGAVSSDTPSSAPENSVKPADAPPDSSVPQTSADAPPATADASATTDPSAPSDEQAQDQKDASLQTQDTTTNPNDIPAPTLPKPQTDPFATLKGFSDLVKPDLFTGEARFEFSPAIPPGRRGFTPSLTLSYSSFKKDLLSPYGYGFDFSTNSVFRRGEHGVDQLYLRNDFAVKINGKYADLVAADETGSRYVAKLGNDMSRYAFSNNSWTVTDTEGTVYQFGANANARQVDPQNTSNIFQWMLETATDTRGNRIEYSYFQDNNQPYLNSIRYSFLSDNAPLYEIRFSYTKKITAATSYLTQFPVATNYLLTEIGAYEYATGSPAQIRRYIFAYDAFSEPRSHLTSITEEASGISLPPITFTYYISAASARLLQTIQNNRGGTITLLYRPSTSYKQDDATLSNAIPFIVQTLSQKILNDAVTGLSSSVSYEYNGGHYFYDFQNIWTREYAGFHEVKETDADGNVTKTYFHQSQFAKDNAVSAGQGEFEDHISKKGRPYREERYDKDGRLMSSTITQWAHRQIIGDAYIVFRERSTHLIWNTDGSHKDSAEEFAYDLFGNVITDHALGEVAANSATGEFSDVGIDGVTITITYSINAEANILTLPATRTIADYTLARQSQERYYYDNLTLGSVSKGNLTAQEQWLNTTSGYVTTTRAYNSYGLVTASTDPRGNTTSYSYDQYTIYPATVTNALGHNTAYTYDYGIGQMKRATDPNGVVLENTYDGLGRLVKVAVSDQNQSPTLITKQEVAYNDASIPTSIYTKEYLSSLAQPKETYSYSDGFGRSIQTRASTETTGAYSVATLVYDSKGRVQKEYQPYQAQGSAYQLTTQPDSEARLYTYDALNRVTSVATNIGATTNTYSDWDVLVTDPNSHQRKSIYDAYGRIAQADEYKDALVQTTRYTYDGIGNLATITDADGNARAFTYDSLNRQVRNELLHKTSGVAQTYTYTYDASGNKVSETDPRGKTVQFTYDALNRIATKDDTGTPALDAAYSYDTSQYGTGKIASITATSTKIGETEPTTVQFSYRYDGEGNRIEEKQEIISPPPAIPKPSPSFTLSGWAWSASIGWISFSCKNREADTGKKCLDSADSSFNPSLHIVDYGVLIDGVTGAFSGYGWNDRIGWISFNRTDTAVPPVAPYNNNEQTFIAHLEKDGAITGWARAVMGKTADWDGWIKLSGIAGDGSSYGVSLNKSTGTLNGWMYGGAVVGWVNVNCANRGTCESISYHAQADVAQSAPSPIALWKFDEGTGTVAGDASGNGNTGTINGGAQWTSGISGTALQFDGIDDFVSKANPLFIDNTQGTVSAWVKFDTTASSRIIWSTSVDGATDDEFYFALYNGALEIVLYVNKVATLDLITANNAIADNNFHHVVVTSDGTTIKLYIDSVEKTLTALTGSNTGQWFASATDAAVFTAGALLRSFNPLALLKGKLDDIRVYNTALTALAIGTLYETSNTPNPIALWKFDEGTGTIANDLSGNNNTGTIQGNAQWTSGVFGKALDFDGVDDYVDIGENFPDTIEQSGTISAWAYRRSNGGGIFARSVNGSWDGERLVVFFNNYGNGVSWGWSIGNGGWPQTAGFDNTTFPDNQWVHFALTWDGTTVTTYLNGQIFDQRPQGQAPEVTGVKTRLGWSEGLGNQSMNGKLDDVRVYATALTREQVNALYAAKATEPVSETAKTGYQYDPYGALTQITYPDNTLVSYTYNALGKIKTVAKNGAPVVSSITYTPTEAISRIDYANGAVQIYTYDPSKLYRLTFKTATIGSQTLQNISYIYDPVGNITRITDTGIGTPKDASYTYDDLDRLIAATITDTATSQIIAESYTYSPTGNILSKTDQSGTKTYGYTDPRHPNAVTSAGSDTYTYDGSGNMTSEMRNGKAISYNYDGFNRLAYITTNSGTTASDSSGNNNTGTLTNGAHFTSPPDGFNNTPALSSDGLDDGVTLPQNMLSGKTAITISAWVNFTGQNNTRYIYLRYGTTYPDQFYIQDQTNLLNLDINSPQGRWWATSSNPVPQGGWHYVTGVYDSTQQVSSKIRIYIDGILANTTSSEAAGGDGALQNNSEYISSPVGGAFNGMIDEMSVYGKALSGSDVLSLYTSKGTNGVPTQDLIGYYRFNEGTSATSYLYGDGYERVKKMLPNGKSTTYLGDIAEADEQGAFTDYVFANPGARSMRVATVDKTGIYYGLSDHLGSASLELDANGAVAQKLDYLPFGSERVNVKSGAFDTRFTFTDQEKDAESGLLYYGARYYHPVLGRFLQVDPVVRDNVTRKEFAFALANPQLLNAYSYVGNNPIKHVDEEGEFPFLFVAGIVFMGVLWHNVTPAYAPGLYTPLSATQKTFAEVAIPQYDQLPGAVKEGIRWAPILMMGMEGVEKEGAEMVADRVATSRLSTPVAQDAAAGALKFGQKSVGNVFSHGPFKDKTIGYVAAGLRNGTISPDQLPIQFIVRDGERIAFDNRSFTALTRAGLNPTKLINVTGIQEFENELTRRLKEMGGKGSDFIRIRGSGVPRSSSLK